MAFTDLLIDYENGELDDDQVIELFQQIFDTKAYTWLQGHYGRTCEYLYNQGLISWYNITHL